MKKKKVESVGALEVGRSPNCADPGPKMFQYFPFLSREISLGNNHPTRIYIFVLVCAFEFSYSKPNLASHKQRVRNHFPTWTKKKHTMKKNLESSSSSRAAFFGASSSIKSSIRKKGSFFFFPLSFSQSEEEEEEEKEKESQFLLLVAFSLSLSLLLSELSKKVSLSRRKTIYSLSLLLPPPHFFSERKKQISYTPNMLPLSVQPTRKPRPRK